MKRITFFISLVCILNACCRNEAETIIAKPFIQDELKVIPYQEKDSLLFVDRYNSIYYLTCIQRKDTQLVSKREVNGSMFCAPYYDTSIMNEVSATLSGNILNTSNTPIYFRFKLDSRLSNIRGFDISIADEACCYHEFSIGEYNSSSSIKLSGFKTTFLDSLQVNNKIYRDVYITIMDKSYNSSKFVDSLFYSSEEGLIRFTTHENNYFNIVK